MFFGFEYFLFQFGDIYLVCLDFQLALKGFPKGEILQQLLDFLLIFPTCILDSGKSILYPTSSTLRPSFKVSEPLLTALPLFGSLFFAQEASFLGLEAVAYIEGVVIERLYPIFTSPLEIQRNGFGHESDFLV